MLIPLNRGLLFLMSFIFAPLVYAGNWSQENIAGMNVHLYTPTTAGSLNGQRALMISLHGCAQSAADLKSGANWQATADSFGMVVALPDVPNGGVIIGCWDYYGSSQTRTNKHNDNLINLTQTLQSRSELDIDVNQTYLTGLSSGGGQTAVLACLAPDIFAGVGIVAGPTIGTSSGQIGSVATSLNSAKNLCLNWAGSNSAQFTSQLTSVAFGTSDTLVAKGYSDLNAQVYASIYGASLAAGSTSIPGSGTQTTWIKNLDTRVEKISIAGMAHAWPAGAGTLGSSNYIDHGHVDYPLAVTEFFYAHNLRAITNQKPVMGWLNLAAENGVISIAGNAVDNDGSILNVHIDIAINGGSVASIDTNVDAVGDYSEQSGVLADGLYTIAVTAEDDGAASNEVDGFQRVGEVPPNSAPVLLNPSASVNGDCVTLTATVTDVDVNLSTVNALINTSTSINLSATSADLYSNSHCGLGQGNHSAVITAQDSEGASSVSTLLSFSVENLAVTATLPQHISAGRLDYTAYATCYLTYGFDAFAISLNAENRWSDGGSCYGPVQADGGDGGDGGNSDCTEFTSSTASHLLAGRVQLCNLFSYCAVGSGDYVGLYSSFNSKTLAQTSSNYYQLGSCP